jgi:hypothetical protein
VMPPRVTPLKEGIAERKRRYERLNDELQKVLEGFRDCADERVRTAEGQRPSSDAANWAYLGILLLTCRFLVSRS